MHPQDDVDDVLILADLLLDAGGDLGARERALASTCSSAVRVAATSSMS